MFDGGKSQQSSLVRKIDCPPSAAVERSHSGGTSDASSPMIGSRKATRLSMAIVALAAAACEPTGLDQNEQDGLIEGTWAGSRWTGAAFVSSTTGLETYLHAWSPSGSREDATSSVSVRIRGVDVGTYQVSAGDARFDYLVGGDGVTASYGTSDDFVGTVVIEEIDSDDFPRARARGRVQFDAVSVNADPPVGQLARFEATFEGPYYTIVAVGSQAR
jgi:hypothetical protein